jgi:hypothetical protein
MINSQKIDGYWWVATGGNGAASMRISMNKGFHTIKTLLIAPNGVMRR